MAISTLKSPSALLNDATDCSVEVPAAEAVRRASFSSNRLPACDIAQEPSCREVRRPGGVRLETQNVNLELIGWPLLGRPGVQGYLIGLQQHRQVLSQHVRNVVFQGLCPTIVLGQGKTILGDPGNYLVLIEVSGQVDGPDADRSAAPALASSWPPPAQLQVQEAG